MIGDGRNILAEWRNDYNDQSKALRAQPGTVRLQRGETVVHRDFVSMPSSLRGLS